MKRRALKIMLTTVLCLGALATSALAQVNIQVDIGVPPPPARYEVIEQGRPGWVWIPGFWYWEGHRHQWADGHWERARPGFIWVVPRWERRGEFHHYEPGRWEPVRHEGRGDRGRDEGRGHDEGRGRDRDDDRGRDHDRR